MVTACLKINHITRDDDDEQNIFTFKIMFQAQLENTSLACSSSESHLSKVGASPGSVLGFSFPTSDEDVLLVP